MKIKVKESVSVYEQHLHEMARVGFADDLIVWVWTDDPGYVPHVHVLDRTTKGDRLDACVQLGKAVYFPHGHHIDTLNASQRKAFDQFMRRAPANGLTKTNYEYAVALWNDNNSQQSVSVSRDEAGDAIIPDYTSIAAYKEK